MNKPHVSVAQQLEAVEYACQRQAQIVSGQTVRSSGSRSREEYDLQRLQAARATMDWFRRHELDLRELMALPPRLRRALLSAATKAAPHDLRIEALDADAERAFAMAVRTLVETATIEGRA